MAVQREVLMGVENKSPLSKTSHGFQKAPDRTEVSDMVANPPKAWYYH
jgi:hypothetical protein